MHVELVIGCLWWLVYRWQRQYCIYLMNMRMIEYNIHFWKKKLMTFLWITWIFGVDKANDFFLKTGHICIWLAVLSHIWKICYIYLPGFFCTFIVTRFFALCKDYIFVFILFYIYIFVFIYFKIYQLHFLTIQLNRFCSPKSTENTQTTNNQFCS